MMCAWRELCSIKRKGIHFEFPIPLLEEHSSARVALPRRFCADLLSSCSTELHGTRVFAGVSAAAQEQRRVSSVQLAETKQLISLFLCQCQYVSITVMGPCWYPQVANLHEISCVRWALNNILGSLVKKVVDGFYRKDWKFSPSWDRAFSNNTEILIPVFLSLLINKCLSLFFPPKQKKRSKAFKMYKAKMCYLYKEPRQIKNDLRYL